MFKTLGTLAITMVTKSLASVARVATLIVTYLPKLVEHPTSGPGLKK